jgi:hypothetical protein
LCPRHHDVRPAAASQKVLPLLRAQVHDELVLSVPVDVVEDVGRTVVEGIELRLGRRYSKEKG